MKYEHFKVSVVFASDTYMIPSDTYMIPTLAQHSSNIISEFNNPKTYVSEPCRFFEVPKMVFQTSWILALLKKTLKILF